jgi:hypothetical protein
MKYYITSGKLTAQAETIKDIETLVALKNATAPKEKRTYKKRRKTFNAWTLMEEQELLGHLYQGKKPRQIAPILKRTGSEVNNRIAKLRKQGHDIPSQRPQNA